jgi:probable phosphoglycerate mutase
MTHFLLTRHATCEHVGHSLAGRASGRSLDADGVRQAVRLAERLAASRIDAVDSSPLERARETAAIVAGPRGLAVGDAPGFTEIDFGEWTGYAIEELRGDDVFRRFNTFRSGTRIPGGESILEVQHRAVAELERLRREHDAPDARVLIVSHADVIRSTLAWFLGVPVDLASRVAVEPASVSVLALDDEGARVLRLNDTGDAP